MKTFYGTSSVRWSPDGLYIAVGSKFGSVGCVDVRTRKTFDLTLQGDVHKGTSKTSLAWASWDPHLLATAGTRKDCMVHLWSLSGSNGSGDNYKHLQSAKFSSKVTSLHFSPHIRELLITYGNAKKEAPKPSRHRRHSRTTPSISPPPQIQRGIVISIIPTRTLTRLTMIPLSIPFYLPTELRF